MKRKVWPVVISQRVPGGVSVLSRLKPRPPIPRESR